MAEENSTILDAAKTEGIIIPTLCYLKGVQKIGACRICLVEIEGLKNLVLSCDTRVKAGMKIFTASDKVLNQRKLNIELLLSNHHNDCLSCIKNTRCKLQQLSANLDCNSQKFDGDVTNFKIDESSHAILRNNNKCILCNKCVAVCSVVQNVHAFSKNKRGFKTEISCPYEVPLAQSNCVDCGQCTLVCPTAALMEKNDIPNVRELLENDDYFVCAMVAPSVRVALAEEFGAEIGTFDEGRLVRSLKAIGFDKVFDINVGADFTVVEEAKELTRRLENNERLPHFTSCCPAWVNYVEKFHPELKNNLSDCKSPNEMLGLIVQKFYKNKTTKQVKIVSIMPCTAKKSEIVHHNQIDYVLTTRELAEFIRMKNINYNLQKPDKFDSPFGDYSGAGAIFGSRGGVAEAVLRTLYDKYEKENHKVDFEIVRNSSGIKQFELTLNNKKIKGAIVSGLGNVEQLIKKLQNKEVTYDFIEVMACPGGCVNGGGQPLVDYDIHDLQDVINKRANGLYSADKNRPVRISSKSKTVAKVYSELFNNDDEKIRQALHN